MTHLRTRRRLRRSAVATALLTALAAVMVPSSAHAVTMNIEYDVSGSSQIASTGSSIGLGPATLSVDIDSTGAGAFTGSMPLPGTRTQFKVAGFLPVTADVSFVDAAPLQGQIIRVGRTRVLETTASYYIKLSNIKAVGLPLFAGPFCRTKEPVQISANTPAGQTFDLMAGGTLTGEYTIGDFKHCGLNTLLINELVPGAGNSVEIQVSNGRQVA